MRAGLGVGEHVGEQLALLELQPFLVGERALRLGGHLRRARTLAGEERLGAQGRAAGLLEVAPGGVRHTAPTRSGSSALRVKRPALSSSGANARRSNSS